MGFNSLVVVFIPEWWNHNLAPQSITEKPMEVKWMICHYCTVRCWPTTSSNILTRWRRTDFATTQTPARVYSGLVFNGLIVNHHLRVTDYIALSVEYWCPNCMYIYHRRHLFLAPLVCKHQKTARKAKPCLQLLKVEQVWFSSSPRGQLSPPSQRSKVGMQDLSLHWNSPAVQFSWMWAERKQVEYM